jgi:hypothetical protein
MTHPPSRLCPSDLRHSVPCKFRALTITAVLPRCAASYPLPVRQASALPSASSRFAVTHDTLAVQLTLPLAGRVEDFHLQVSAPCRAQSGRRRGRPRRPPTPPYIRFRIRRSPCRVCRGLSPPNRPTHHHSEPNSASHGTTRHAWRTTKKAPRKALKEGLKKTSRIC